MKRLLLILILTLSFQTWTKADDIRDFQIEGMSIGDSALDYFSKSEIKKYSSRGNYKDKSFLYSSIPYKKNGYTKINFHYKNKDKSYKVYAISGVIYFKDNYKKCLIKQAEIEEEVSPLLKSFTKKIFERKKNSNSKSGERDVYAYHYLNDNNDQIRIACTDWSKKMKYIDHLRLDVLSKEFREWINNKAFK